MPVFLTGSQDHFECLMPLHQPDPAFQHLGAPPCLAYKFTVSWMALPYSASDGGYVITAPGAKDYFALTSTQISDLQAAGEIGSPLPAYEIPIGWRMSVYSPWLLFALIAGIAAWKHSHRRRLARDRERGTTSGPLVIDRPGDRAIADALAPHLEPGEVITHQAYATDRVPDSISASLRGLAHWVALTDRRLLLMTNRIGLFGRFRGRRKLVAIPRSAITSVVAEDEKLMVETTFGTFRLIVPFRAARCSPDNQRALLTDLPLIAAPLPVAIAREAKGS